ncbi:thioredoxin-like domain-containing protein [uncultured Lutibacter sp.]|uniref:TlpA family protein disulfide reductase n=1 Tax=uncultured Lutibacter sp. TaxID=437739 RepID=UPI002628D675|nr:thioredoxin-like domain-containing protein [uncultured Lutibacter sp.]
MLKQLLPLFLLISFTVSGQHFVKGKVEPISKENNWIILYQLKGAKQLYVKNATITNGEFKIDFPENSSPGMYRLMYDMQHRGFVDFIYNNENIELDFNRETPSTTLNFLVSEENKIYNEYTIKTSEIRQQLDSVQLLFFRLTDTNEQLKSQKIYTSLLLQKNNLQTNFEQLSKGKLVNSFIYASNKYYAKSLINNPQAYLNSEKKHYFDFINFEDDNLKSSSFFSEKIIDYVFYLNSSEDVEVQNVLYKNAVNEVMQKVGNHQLLKSELLTTLLYTFAQVENVGLIDFILESYYKKLPKELIDLNVIKDIQLKVKLAIGKYAPEITWEENGITKNLSELNNADQYMVVFWSTSCSHCLNEIPKLYEYTKDKPKIHVIAIALEMNDVEFKKQTQNLTKWTNILGLKKWENPIAREYEINATPTYFILDATKKIISKPYYFENVKEFFEH